MRETWKYEQRIKDSKNNWNYKFNEEIKEQIGHSLMGKSGNEKIGVNKSPRIQPRRRSQDGTYEMLRDKEGKHCEHTWHLLNCTLHDGRDDKFYVYSVTIFLMRKK